MGTATSTGTLTAGNSRTFNLAPASAVTLTLLPNVRVTITETPATVTATSLGGNASRVHEPRLPGVVTYGPYPMGGSVLVENESNSGSTVTWVETSAVYATDSSGNVTGLVGPDGEDVVLWRDMYPSDGYWTHIHAAHANRGSQIAPDISGSQNHGTCGANLSAAQLAATQDYYSTVLPATGVTDSVLRFPPLYHQWLQGENLFLFWSGIVTPGGATEAIIGNTADTSIAGFRVRCYSTGRMDVVVHDGAGGTQFASQTTNDAAGKPFVAGELHSISVFFNALTGKVQQYVDGLLNKENILVPKDEVGGYTFNIGSVRPAPGLVEGLATQTRALVILRGRYGLHCEHLAPLLAQRLHENPARVVTNFEW